MEAKQVPEREPTLNDHIVAVLKEALGPMRALDIVQKLGERGVTSDAKAVNSLLYKGSKDLYEKAPGAGTPSWRLRAVAPAPEGGLVADPGQILFQVDNVGSMALGVHLADTQVEALFGFLATLVPNGEPKTYRHADTVLGKKYAALAVKAGFAAVASLAK